jgi:hypothetical protein
MGTPVGMVERQERLVHRYNIDGFGKDCAPSGP